MTGKSDCEKDAPVTNAATVNSAMPSTFKAVDTLFSAFEPTMRASITIGGVTISMPSATVVIHDRKKSTPLRVSSVATMALAALAASAATQKRPTACGTMNDISPGSRRRISHSAIVASAALATV